MGTNYYTYELTTCDHCNQERLYKKHVAKLSYGWVVLAALKDYGEYNKLYEAKALWWSDVKTKPIFDEDGEPIKNSELIGLMRARSNRSDLSRSKPSSKYKAVQFNIIDDDGFSIDLDGCFGDFS